MPVAQFTGLASGIDSKALIDAIIEGRTLTNKTRQKEIDFLESSNDSLEQLNTKMLALSDLVDKFRLINGGGIQKKASSSDSTVATAIAGSSSGNASYGLTVTSVADSANGALYNSTPYSSATSVFQSGAGSGSIQILVGTGGDQVSIDVSVTLGTTTVQEVVDAINADSDSPGRVSASLVNLGTTSSPNYQIMISTVQQGTAKGTLAITPTGLADVNVSTIDQATDAQFTLAGLSGTITRTSNSVSDVAPGMTFNLYKAGSASITVADDSDSTADLMGQIVSGYNDLVKFVNENNQITRVKNQDNATNVYGSLAKTRADDDFLASFREDLAGATSSNGTTVTGLAALGVKTNRDGTLTFDSDAFKTALGADPVGTSEVLQSFADAAGGISGTIYKYTSFQGVIDVAVDANKSQIDNLNDAINQLNRSSAKYREALEFQFSKLESISAKLQSQQSSLSGLISSLS